MLGTYLSMILFGMWWMHLAQQGHTCLEDAGWPKPIAHGLMIAFLLMGFLVCRIFLIDIPSS